MSHPHIIEALAAPWACLPEYHAMVLALVEASARGERVDLVALQAKRNAPLPGPVQGYDVRDGVAIIPVIGAMSQRMNLMAEVSGGVSSELLARDIKAAAADPKVAAILLQIDSPGGAVAGTPQVAAAMMAARQQKPTASLAEGTMASAAYWAGSAAERVFLSSPVDTVGSIGVIARHIDRSRANHDAGITQTDIVAGRYKAAASDNGPLSETGRQVIQDRVDAIYRIFVGDVANHRGVSVDRVLGDMADGRVFIGRQAVDAGLADGFGSVDAVVADLKDRAKWRPIASSGNRRSSTMSASVPLPPL